MNAEIMRTEILGERFQQRGIGRLNCPRRRWRVRRIQSLQIETVVRLDQADHHQLLPNDVYRRARKLDVSRQDPA